MSEPRLAADDAWLRLSWDGTSARAGGTTSVLLGTKVREGSNHDGGCWAAWD